MIRTSAKPAKPTKLESNLEKLEITAQRTRLRLGMPGRLRDLYEHLSEQAGRYALSVRGLRKEASALSSKPDELIRYLLQDGAYEFGLGAMDDFPTNFYSMEFSFGDGKAKLKWESSSLDKNLQSKKLANKIQKLCDKVDLRAHPELMNSLLESAMYVVQAASYAHKVRVDLKKDFEADDSYRRPSPDERYAFGLAAKPRVKGKKKQADPFLILVLDEKSLRAKAAFYDRKAQFWARKKPRLNPASVRKMHGLLEAARGR